MTSPTSWALRSKAEPNRHRMVWRAVKWLISLLLLTWLLSRVDSETVSVIAAFPPIVLVTSLAIFATSQIFGALRLWILLRSQGSHFSPLYLTRLTFIGFFASNFLPSTVGGDVYKGLALTRQGHELKLTILTLLADRVVSLTVIALITAAALPFTSFRSRWSVPTGFFSHNFLTMLLAVTVAVLLCVALLRGPKSIARFIASFRERTVSVARRVLRILVEPRILALAVLLSCLSTGVSILGQFVIAHTLGMRIDVIQLAAVIGLVTLAALMPISINGLGIQEAGLISLLHLLDIPLGAAIAFAILSRVLILGTSLVGGVVLLLSGDSRANPRRIP